MGANVSPYLQRVSPDPEKPETRPLQEIIDELVRGLRDAAMGRPPKQSDLIESYNRHRNVATDFRDEPTPKVQPETEKQFYGRLLRASLGLPPEEATAPMGDAKMDELHERMKKLHGIDQPKPGKTPQRSTKASSTHARKRGK